MQETKPIQQKHLIIPTQPLITECKIGIKTGLRQHQQVIQRTIEQIYGYILEVAVDALEHQLLVVLYPLNHLFAQVIVLN